MELLGHLLAAAALGTVQGITEFLPVSSTGHMILGQALFGLDPKVYGLSFDMFTNLGTIAAVVWFFRSDLSKTFSSLRLPKKGTTQSQESLFAWRILGITTVVGIVGAVTRHYIENELRSLSLVLFMLVVFSLVMLAAEHVAKQTPRSTNASSLQQWLIGLSQAVAFIPGVSRSGVTISTGLFAGVSRSTAARLSFLLSAPITTLAAVVQVSSAASKIASTGITLEVSLFYLTGLITATIAGYFSIAFLLRYLEKASLAVFAYYRLALVAVVLTILALTALV